MAQAGTLPFFPLGLVAFPGELVKLHIFEERYRQLFRELRQGGGSFALIPVIDQRLRPLGTEMALERVAKTYPSGELDVETRGVAVVEVRHFEEVLGGKLYAGGETARLDYELEASKPALAGLLTDKCGELYKILGVHRDLPPAGTTGYSFAVGHALGLSPKQEYELLALATEDERLEFLLAQVDPAIERAREAAAMRHRIQMNGHFRYVPPNR